MFESDEDDEDADDEDEEEEDDDDDEERDDENDSGSEDEDATNESDKIREAERNANTALAKALGISGGDEDVNMDDDDDNLDDDEESMDDEQMMALDDQLATIFRERRKALTEHGTVASRKRSQDAKTNMVHFKARVIDLLEIYVVAQSESPLILTAIVPLIKIIKSSHDKSLTDRAHALLKSKLCKTKTLPILAKVQSNEDKTMSEEGDEETEETRPNGPVTADQLIASLITIHTLARSSNRVQLSLACNQASVFLSKVLLSNDMSHAEEVVAIYSQTLSDWLIRPNSNTQAAMFFEFINWVNTARSQLHKAAKKTGSDSKPQ